MTCVSTNKTISYLHRLEKNRGLPVVDVPLKTVIHSFLHVNVSVVKWNNSTWEPCGSITSNTSFSGQPSLWTTTKIPGLKPLLFY